MFHGLVTAVKTLFWSWEFSQNLSGEILVPPEVVLGNTTTELNCYTLNMHSYSWCAGRFVCKSYNLSTSPTQFWATDCKFTSGLRWNKLDTHYSLLKWTIIWNMTVWTGSCARATMFQLLLHSSERQTASLSVACGGTSWTLTMTLIYTPHSSSQINCQHHLWKNTCRSIINQSIVLSY